MNRLTFTAKLLVLALLVALPQVASAGCCLDGSTEFSNYSGVMVLPTGNTDCAWQFTQCDISVYHYRYCQDGPDYVASFRVHPGSNCNIQVLGICVSLTACGYLYTPEGYAFECGRVCPF